MYKYVIGAAAGALVSWCIAASTVTPTGPQSYTTTPATTTAPNCDAWAMDVTILKTAIFILCNQDVRASNEVLSKMSTLAMRSMGVTNKSYVWEYDKLPESTKQEINDFARAILQEYNRQVMDVERRDISA